LFGRNKAVQECLLSGLKCSKHFPRRKTAVQRLMLRSKIHRATLTGADLDYEGSIALDRDLMEAADLLPGEQVHVLNLNNAQRLITYVIEAPAGSGTVLLNGPAARLGQKGDVVRKNSAILDRGRCLSTLKIISSRKRGSKACFPLRVRY
jgi:L-aspartate-alpha-decarboxylase